MADEIIIFSIITIVIMAIGLILNNLWSAKQRKDRSQERNEKKIESKEDYEAAVEKKAQEKVKAEQVMARELAKENELLLERFKDNLRDYVDKGDLDVKREIAYAVKLLEKDIKFIQQFIFGRDSKSMAAYTRGEEETAEHDAAEGQGIFKDTQEEAKEREDK